jgi:hypothetical protein
MTESWPSLEKPRWEATRDHLRLWTQMVGKTALALAPPVNHWWHVALHITARGLSTKPLPLPGSRTCDIELDLLTHRLIARSSDGVSGEVALQAGKISDFYARYRELLTDLRVHPHIWPHPVESVESIPFDEDHQDRPYEPEWATSFFNVLRELDHLFTAFRGRFVGKASPSHFFWGSVDLATTRFSGRLAPRHPGGIPNCADYITTEAYSHECSSAGFWPGGGGYPRAALYSYAYPEPAGFADAPVTPEGAFYSRDLREFLLPYDSLRQNENPQRATMSFLQSTYLAAAMNGRWNREALELEARGAQPWTQAASTSIGSVEAPHP